MASQSEVTSTLWEFMRTSLEDGGGVAAVHGALGVGKTVSLERFAREARDAGTVVREVAGVLTERDVPLGLIKRLFDDEIARNADAERLLEATHCCGGEVTQLCGPCHSLASRMYAQIEESLRRIDGTSPTVLIVDDLYLADAPSLWVLRSLLYRLQRLPVFLILSGCYPADSRQLRDFRFDLMKNNPSLLSLELSLFTSREAAKLIRKVTGSRPTPAHVKEAMELTGGNARLLAAVAQGMKALPGSGHSPEQGLDQGPGFREVVKLLVCNSYVANLEGVARAMAVLGGGVPVALLSALSGVEPTETADAVELIEAIGLASDGAFRHPAIRAVILEDPAFRERVDFHRSAARLLHQRGASAREVAEYILAAGVTTESWETAVLREAARQAQVHGEWHEAVNCLDLARTSPCDPGEQPEVLMETVCAKWRVDAHAALSHLPELVSLAQGGRLSGRSVISVSAMLAWTGRQTEADQLLGLLSDPDRGELDRHLSLVGRPQAAPGQATAPDPSPAGPEHATTSAALWLGDATAAVVDADMGRTPRAFKVWKQTVRSYFLDADQANWITDVGFFTTRLLNHICLVLPEMPCLDGLEKDASARMSPFRRMMLHCSQAVSALTGGNPAKAEKDALSALSQPSSWGIYVGLPLSVLILSQVQQGKFEEVKSTLRIPVPVKFYESEPGRLYLYSRGMYRLAIRMPYSALGDFLACGEIENRLAIPSVSTCPWRSRSAQAYLLLGREKEATRTAKEVIATSGDTWAKAIALRVLALARPVESRADLLRDAVGLLEGGVHRVELAICLYELGRTHYALDLPKAGRVLNRRAWSIAGFAGFEPLLRAVVASGPADAVMASSPADLAADDDPGEAPDDRRQRPDTSAKPSVSGADLLSSAERRVAWLAGIGHSNREVAIRLSITVSTVEQHLTKIYRKLGLKRREDLVTAVPIPSDGLLR
ncbi:AAA family ATPase [Streptomyces adonidis]|uniref:AAA family ATPase n=1 Tax=Streptomyces adonidis TaxID=3231367 RepID=UPI0034DB34AE